jgi:hypothetical protein
MMMKTIATLMSTTIKMIKSIWWQSMDKKSQNSTNIKKSFYMHVYSSRTSITAKIMIRCRWDKTSQGSWAHKPCDITSANSWRKMKEISLSPVSRPHRSIRRNKSMKEAALSTLRLRADPFSRSDSQRRWWGRLTLQSNLSKLLGALISSWLMIRAESWLKTQII